MTFENVSQQANPMMQAKPLTRGAMTVGSLLDLYYATVSIDVGIGCLYRTHSGVDNANQCQADARHNEQSADIVETPDCFSPWDTTRVLRWVVEPDDTTESQQLENEANPVNILPVPGTRIDGITTDDRTNDNNHIYKTIRDTDTDMAELVGHQLRDRAHCHLTEPSAETCDAKSSSELRWAVGGSRDDEADAADCISEDEDDSSAEEVAVGTSEDESD